VWGLEKRHSARFSALGLGGKTATGWHDGRMTKRWTKVAERLGRAFGYKTKSNRAQQLAADDERARQHSHVAEENERAGRRYLRP
jgi:hypothetical protein